MKGLKKTCCLERSLQKGTDHTVPFWGTHNETYIQWARCCRGGGAAAGGWRRTVKRTRCQGSRRRAEVFGWTQDDHLDTR
jgi:hypothetical protein